MWDFIQLVLACILGMFIGSTFISDRFNLIDTYMQHRHHELVRKLTRIENEQKEMKEQIDAIRRNQGDIF